MPVIRVPGMRPVHMGDMRAEIAAERDGTVYIRSQVPLDAYPDRITDCLDRWAAEAPERIFLADRGGDGDWRKVTYAEARSKARALAQGLIELGLSAERPIAVLSGNDIEHGLLALAAFYAGIPIAPISPAYSLVSSDLAKLRYVLDLVTPGLIFADDGARFARAFDVVSPEATLLVRRNPVPGRRCLTFDDLMANQPGETLERATAAVTSDTVAKFLFSSGSTGMPKAIINTQRMLTCNQEMIATALAFLKDKPPVMVDWLPWNHTAGGNHNFGIALYNGGTLYIDDGKPTPQGIHQTVRNLMEVAPTLYFNVPKGYEALLEHLETNEALRERFFSRVELLQYAGAGLSAHVWEGLERVAQETVGERIMMITGYGSTETAPFAFTTTWAVDRPGEVGLPAAGLEVKLVPNHGKLELRLKGPNVTPGYWRQPDKTAESFDEEGYYKIGDALKFVDRSVISKGFVFDGRTSEDFKLATGTWVNLAAVRSQVIGACAPYVRDVVLAGLDRNFIGALLLLDIDAARKAAPELGPNAGESELAHHTGLRAHIQDRLEKLAATSTGSSTLVARAIVLDTPPSIDAHEVTDKGSINQRAVLAARAPLVEDLYTDPPPAHVLVVTGRAGS